MSQTTNNLHLIVNCEAAKEYKTQLETRLWIDKSRRIFKLDAGRIAIPVLHHILAEADQSITQDIVNHIEPQSTHQDKITPGQQLVKNIKLLCEKHSIKWDVSLESDLPKKWQFHSDLVLLHENCLCLPIWSTFGATLWRVVADSLGVLRVARQHTITDDTYRSPQVDLLLGDHGWVQHVDNRVKYTFDITKCMFSSGNITEKLRISQMNCKGKTVVDLYAGIGYFTLQYLVHTDACHVHACEWNPASVDALQRALVLNKVTHKCTIHQGDNKQFCPHNTADVVNLGLIPSSEHGWFVACRALNVDRGGLVLVHGNVNSQHHHNHDKGKQLNGRQIERSLPELGHTVVDDVIKTRTAPELQMDDEECGIPLLSGEYHSADIDLDIRLYPDYVSENYKEWHKLKATWQKYSCYVAEKFQRILLAVHGNAWTCRVVHVEHVKSFAPHVDHMVIDVECVPMIG